MKPVQHTFLTPRSIKLPTSMSPESKLNNVSPVGKCNPCRDATTRNYLYTQHNLTADPITLLPIENKYNKLKFLLSRLLLKKVLSCGAYLLLQSVLKAVDACRNKYTGV